MQIRLTDLQGKCCLEMLSAASSATFNVGSLAPGMYLCTAVSGGKVYPAKVVVGGKK